VHSTLINSIVTGTAELCECNCARSRESFRSVINTDFPPLSFSEILPRLTLRPNELQYSRYGKGRPSINITTYVCVHTYVHLYRNARRTSTRD